MSGATGPAARAACAVGIDVGGTKIAGGLVLAATGEPRALRRVPTRPERGGRAVLDDALELARGLLGEAGVQGLAPVGIGAAVCELVEPGGEVASAQTIPWRGVAVRAAFASLAPAVVEADARAAALGEAAFGAGRPFRGFLYVTVGTGIGSALVIDGRPYTGSRGLTGTLASGPLTFECTACGAATQAVLEEIASGPALLARYRRRGGSAESTEEVLALAAAGDAPAAEVVRSAGGALGSTVGLLVSVLDPEAVIVGGGVGSAGGPYWDAFVASTRAHVWSELHRGLPILPAAHGADAGVVGAAAAALASLGSVGSPLGR